MRFRLKPSRATGLTLTKVIPLQLLATLLLVAENDRGRERPERQDELVPSRVLDDHLVDGEHGQVVNADPDDRDCNLFGFLVAHWDSLPIPAAPTRHSSTQGEEDNTPTRGCPPAEPGGNVS
jgi:hypothetical protein